MNGLSYSKHEMLSHVTEKDSRNCTNLSWKKVALATPSRVLALDSNCSIWEIPSSRKPCCLCNLHQGLSCGYVYEAFAKQTFEGSIANLGQHIRLNGLPLHLSIKDLPNDSQVSTMAACAAITHTSGSASSLPLQRLGKQCVGWQDDQDMLKRCHLRIKVTVVPSFVRSESKGTGTLQPTEQARSCA